MSEEKLTKEDLRTADWQQTGEFNNCEYCWVLVEVRDQVTLWTLNGGLISGLRGQLIKVDSD